MFRGCLYRKSGSPSRVGIVSLLFLTLAACTSKMTQPAPGSAYLQTINTATGEAWMQITHRDAMSCETMRNGMLNDIPALAGFLRCSQESASHQLPVYSDGLVRVEVQTEKDCRALQASATKNSSVLRGTCKTKPDVNLSEQTTTELRYYLPLCNIFSLPKRQQELEAEKEDLLKSAKETMQPERLAAKQKELRALQEELSRANAYFEVSCRPRASCMVRGDLDRQLCSRIESDKERARARLNSAIYKLEQFTIN